MALHLFHAYSATRARSFGAVLLFRRDSCLDPARNTPRHAKRPETRRRLALIEHAEALGGRGA